MQVLYDDQYFEVDFLSGNHALALSYHGQQMGIPVTVVMPIFAPLMKITLCRSYGATVILKGDNIQTVDSLLEEYVH